MSKFLVRFTVIFVVNLIIYSFLVMVKSMNVENVAFYMFIANLLIAFFTKENNTFVQFKGFNDRVVTTTLNPLENDATTLSNSSKVQNILSNFQVEKNATGMAFATTSIIFLLYCVVVYVI